MELKEKCEEHDRIEFIANLLKFNRELMNLDIKRVEEIESLKERLNKAAELIRKNIYSIRTKEEKTNRINLTDKQYDELMRYLEKGVDNNG